MSQGRVLSLSLWMKKELVVDVKLKLLLQIKPFTSICCLDLLGSVSMCVGGGVAGPPVTSCLRVDI